MRVAADRELVRPRPVDRQVGRNLELPTGQGIVPLTAGSKSITSGPGFASAAWTATRSEPKVLGSDRSSRASRWGVKRRDEVERMCFLAARRPAPRAARGWKCRRGRRADRAPGGCRAGGGGLLGGKAPAGRASSVRRPLLGRSQPVLLSADLVVGYCGVRQTSVW